MKEPSSKKSSNDGDDDADASSVDAGDSGKQRQQHETPTKAMTEASEKEGGEVVDGSGEEGEASSSASHDGAVTEDETMEDGATAAGFAQDEMPLFQYSRLQGSLPRPSPPQQQGQSTSLPFEEDCTCSIMGKVVLNAESLAAAEGPSSHSGDMDSSIHDQHREASTRDVFFQQKQPPMPVAAMGFDNGTVRLVDPQTAMAIARPEQLQIRENAQERFSVAALSMDASGCFLAAMDTGGTSGGMCTIFEFRYKLEMVRPQQQRQQQQNDGTTTTSSNAAAATAPTQQQQQQSGNVFTNFMSAITGNPSFTEAAQSGSDIHPTGGSSSSLTALEQTNTSQHGGTTSSSSKIPMLKVASIVQTQRVAYPKSFGRPTCLALDPAYKKRREKSMLVGFADGRLVMTKRGFVFQRRNDIVLYQGVPVDDDDENDNDDETNCAGIQALTWRGSLVAWADASGIRLFDADTQTRIAHVDRPIGARPSLYPFVRRLKPSLCFETSTKLLVAWGDCLLQLKIRDAAVHQQQPGIGGGASSSPGSTSGGGTSDATALQRTPSSGSTGGGGAPAATMRRRVAEVAMAWELDCVACSMSPLDEDHVLVLGLVTPMQSGNENNDVGQEQPISATQEDPVNDVELQVVSRKDGSVVYSDLLPMLRKPQRPGHRRESAAAYSLLSSYFLPRMDDVMELQEDAPDMDDDDYDNEDDEYDPYQVTLFGAAASKKTFRDPHLRWNLKLVSYEEEAAEKDAEDVAQEAGSSEGDSPSDKRGGDIEDDDATSVDSDDYGFVMRPLAPDTNSRPISSKPAIPPTLVIASSSDAVSARVRCVDDAVSYALADKKPALALQRAIRHLPRLRNYNIEDLVNEYFCSLLRIPPEGDDSDKKVVKPLSLRRMKLAASAMPVLMGGSVALWRKWITEVEDVPGALFIIRNVLPVRDPILPKEVYGRALQSMFTNAAQMRASADSDATEERLIVEAENHFLNTLLQWGTTQVLNEHVKLYKYLVDLDPSFSAALESLEDSLRRRYEQTSAVYLSFPARDPFCPDTARPAGELGGNPSQNDSLFDVVAMVEFLEAEDKLKDRRYSRVALDAKAELSMMTGNVDLALRYYLTRGGLHASRSFEAIEQDAVAAVQAGFQGAKSKEKHPYAFVLSLIENKHLFQCLLDASFLSKEAGTLPLIALIRLVGLELAGDFLMEHCVAPQRKTKAAEPGESRVSDRTGGERRGTLPLDLVAAQLEASPKLLYWYLHSVFARKPELYVRFPNTANPPLNITALHRKALDLYISYAGEQRDSVKALMGVEPYRVLEVSTPLLSFLRVVLQLGGISPTAVGKMLQSERKGGAFSRVFALELAYIMEHFGEQTEDNARLILDLYLKGTQSMMLAVSYAQRAHEYKQDLWDILIQHCLGEDSGTLFGALLEAAALSGADLANLVSVIPPGMSIIGLRPRLVQTVADYRMKLQTHQSASQVATTEKIDLLRELAHRSRRGMRYEPSDQVRPPAWATIKAAKGSSSNGEESEPADEQAAPDSPSKLPPSLRPKRRQDRHYLAYSLQIK